MQDDDVSDLLEEDEPTMDERLDTIEATIADLHRGVRFLIWVSIATGAFLLWKFGW
jgi:hypothetical protein